MHMKEKVSPDPVGMKNQSHQSRSTSRTRSVNRHKARCIKYSSHSSSYLLKLLIHYNIAYHSPPPQEDNVIHMYPQQEDRQTIAMPIQFDRVRYDRAQKCVQIRLLCNRTKVMLKRVSLGGFFRVQNMLHLHCLLRHPSFFSYSFLFSLCTMVCPHKLVDWPMINTF
jgi:hypothetical protein